jgi:probable F420-dependent oxidoreductase
MKFSTNLPGTSRYPPTTNEWETAMRPEDFQIIARTAEEVGFDAIMINEHIAMPSEMVGLMGSFWPHAFTVMAFVAGATTNITVDSAVIVMPYHHPVVFAKAVSTLDFLTGGRVRLSIGVGHSQHEFDVLGVPFHERGKVTDEYLAAMIELWTRDSPSFKGKYVEFDDIVFDPKPVQKPYPPIWVGGNSAAAMRRAARHDGWFPWLITADQLPECMDYIQTQPEFQQRTRPWDLALPVAILDVDEEHRPLNDKKGRNEGPATTQAMLDAVGQLQEVGVTSTAVPIPRARSLAEHLEGLHWVAEEIMPAFR